MVVPGGFVVFLEDDGVWATGVVVDEEGDEGVFYCLDDGWMGHDLTTELFAACSAGDFLEEGEDGFA